MSKTGFTRFTESHQTVRAPTARAYLPSGPGKKAALTTENLILEKLRFLWRVVHERRFISAQQHQFVCLKLDEIGRMIGGWIKSLESRKP